MFTVFDIETTGLDSGTCDIVQFAYILFDSNNVPARAESLYFYYDGMHWDQDVADKTHQFSLDFLKQYKDKFRENCIKMFTVLSEAIVIGHNSNKFDVPFVTNWLRRFCFPYLHPSYCEDTMLFMRPLTKRARIKLMSLAELCEVTEQEIQLLGTRCFGEEFTSASAHNAMYDVAATSLITLYALKKGYFSLTGSSMSYSADSSVRVPIESISKDWLDQNHVFYIELKGDNGSKYIGTCDAPHQFEPDTYESIEEMPDAARARLLPITLHYSQDAWRSTIGNVSVVLRYVDGIYILELSSPKVTITSNSMFADIFMDFVKTIAGTPTKV